MFNYIEKNIIAIKTYVDYLQVEDDFGWKYGQKIPDFKKTLKKELKKIKEMIQEIEENE